MSKNKNPMRNWKIDFLLITKTSAVCLLPIIFGLIVYDRLPEKMAILLEYFYMPKAFAIVFLPIIFCITNIIKQFETYYSPEFDKTPIKFTNFSFWLFPAYSIVMQISILLNALGYDISFSRGVNIILGIFLIIEGNYLPKNEAVNSILAGGSDDVEIRRKTRRLAGKMFVIGGAIHITNSFIDNNLVALTILVIELFIMVAVPIIYSRVLEKRKKE